MGAQFDKNRSIEERLRAVEDRLEILNLIAGHPPGADTGDGDYAASFCMADVELEFSEQAPKWIGRETLIANLAKPGHHGALAQGIAHFAGLPYIEIDGDKATVTSYLQILTPNPEGEPFELSAHGTTRGFRIHRVSANRWELERTPEGWRIKKRTGRGMETPAARDLLRQTTAHRRGTRP